jgi:hypothetical protein
MLRKVLAGIAGLVAGAAVVWAAEGVSSALHPPPPGIDPTTPEGREALAAHIRALPAGAFVLVLLAHAAGAFAGGLVATAVAGRTSIVPALVVGALLLAAGAVNVVVIPHPGWFIPVDLLLYLPFAWAGARLLLRRGPGTAAAA